MSKIATAYVDQRKFYSIKDTNRQSLVDWVSRGLPVGNMSY
jgi:hypothetical protein